MYLRSIKIPTHVNVGPIEMYYSRTGIINIYYNSDKKRNGHKQYKLLFRVWGPGYVSYKIKYFISKYLLREFDKPGYKHTDLYEFESNLAKTKKNHMKNYAKKRYAKKEIIERLKYE